MSDILQEKRIFIVEDTSTNLAIMKTLLEGSGVKVGFDKWGLDTLPKLLAFAPVDLILLDLMFPNNVSGYDVFDKIRMVASMAAVPIVAVSASEPGVAIPKTKAKGFAGFIGKPFSYDRFPCKFVKCYPANPFGIAGLYMYAGRVKVDYVSRTDY